MYANFDLLVPEKLDQALGMISKAKAANDFAPLGGGTNLVVEMRAKGVMRGAHRRFLACAPAALARPRWSVSGSLRACAELPSPTAL